MTKEIDVSDPKSLSLEDRIYLQDRERLPEGAEPVSMEERMSLSEPTVLVATKTGSELVPESKVDEVTGNTKDNLETGPDSDDYNDWTVAELRDELSERDLPTSGTKAELVSRLEADDKDNG